MDKFVFDRDAILLILFIVVGLIIFLTSFWLVLKSIISKGWWQTEGQIINAEIFSLNYPTEPGSNYKAKIYYIYEVDGKEYKSNRIYFGSNMPSFLKRFRSQKYLLKYSKDSTTRVYYDPLNESKAVLETGVHVELIFSMALGLAIIFLGCILFL